MVPRFSNVAIGAVLALIATGIGAAILQLPTLSSLWQTGYGQALLVKIALLCVALLLAAVNLLRTRPRLLAGQAPAAALLRRLVGGEVVVVAGAVFAAAVLTSLAPPAKAVADLGKPAASVGPGAVDEDGRAAPATSSRWTSTPTAPPSRTASGRASPRTASRSTGATVTAGFAMLDMEMGTPGLQARGDRARHLRARGAGAGDGRPLGPDVRRRAARRRPVHRDDPRQGQRMSVRTRLLLALLALCLGVVAAMVALSLLNATLH